MEKFRPRPPITEAAEYLIRQASTLRPVSVVIDDGPIPKKKGSRKNTILFDLLKKKKRVVIRAWNGSAGRRYWVETTDPVNTLLFLKTHLKSYKKEKRGKKRRVP